MITDPTPATAACQDATHRTCHHSFATLEEAERFIATYEAERCLCGGSPSWVDPRYRAATTPTVHIAEALAELKRRRDAAKVPTPTTTPSAAPVGDAITITDPAAYVEAAVRRLVAELAQHPKGARNAAAHEAARSVGRMVGAGLPLDPTPACLELLDACRANGLVGDDGEAAAMASIRSGYAWGHEHPLSWVQGQCAPMATPFDMPDERITTAQALNTIEAYRQLAINAEADKLRARRAAARIVDAEDAATLRAAPPGYTWAEFVALKFPDVAWVVDGLAPRGGNVTVTAPYKTGKTTLVGELIAALAGGGPFLGQYDVHLDGLGAIAVWDYEMTPQQHQGWARDLDEHVLGRDHVHLRHLRGAKVKLDTPRGYDEAVEWLQARGVGVWVLDPFARAYLGDENDNGAVTRWTDMLDQLKADAGVHTLVMPVHTGRRESLPGGERARGATRLDDWPDVRWLLSKDPDTGARYFRASGRDVELDEVGVRMLPDRRLVADMPSRDDATLERDVAKALAILRPVGEGVGASKTQLREALRCSGGKVVDGKVGRMVAAHRIVAIGDRYYSPPVGFTLNETD